MKRGTIAHRNALVIASIAVASALAREPDPTSQALAKELPTWARPAKPRKKRRRGVLGLRP